jgi:hypothetical protein
MESETIVARAKRPAAAVTSTPLATNSEGTSCTSDCDSSPSKLARISHPDGVLPCSSTTHPITAVTLKEGSLAARLWAVEKYLGNQLETCVDYGEKVEYVYNPLGYAETLHLTFLQRFLPGVNKTKVLFLGMNPGPFGMVQTGVSTLTRLCKRVWTMKGCCVRTGLVM